METAESFAMIASCYDSMFLRDIAEDVRMLLPLLQMHSVRTVLDCACGTGAHVAALNRHGFIVTGSDASEPMLEQAAGRFREQGIDAPLVNSEWDRLQEAVSGTFDAVICIGNSLPLAGSDAMVLDAVRGMYSKVRPGGALIIQNRNMDKMLREKPDVIVNLADEGHTVFVFEYSGDMVTYKISYNRIEDHGKDVSRSCDFPMNLLTKAKFERMIAEVAGGTSPRCTYYGNSCLTRFSKTESPRMIVTVEKPG